MCGGELRGNPASGVKPYNSTSGSAVARTFLAAMRYVNKLVEVNLKIIIQYNGITKFYF